MIAVVFPGQGSQKPGMGQELFEASVPAREAFERVSRATDVDMQELCFRSDEATLRQTQNALPNQVWRVLHRVTYVERPALMGFGHQQPPRVQVADEMQKLRGQVSQLTAKLESIDSKLNRLLEGK